MAKPNHPMSQKKAPPPTMPKPKNRKRDQQQQQQQPLEVYCRLRPLKVSNVAVALRPISDTQLQVSLPGSNPQIYEFKRVFADKTTQTTVFKDVAFPLVNSLIAGENGLLFTYGVTSAGKTYTITGTPNCPGILPRALDVLFNSLERNGLQTMKYKFKPDGSNGFEIGATPDAILRMQNECNPQTPMSNHLRQMFANPRSAAKTLDSLQKEWEKRERETGIVKETNHDNKYAVFVTYVEIYNNYIYDLLDESSETGQPGTPARTPRNGQNQNMRPSKALREDAKKRMYVQGVSEIEVKDAKEAFDAYLKGMTRRRIGSTQMNSESSRSHSVFTIRLVQAPLDRDGTDLVDNSAYIHISQLSIVDLAGCERTNRTNAQGSRLREAANINNSLLTLRNCFDMLRENQKSPTTTNNKLVPYRDSKLTHLFKSYFEGDGAVKMILCLNPGADDFDETLQVLKFGEQSQEIVTNRGRGARSAFPNFVFDGPLDDLGPLSFGPSYPKRFLQDPEDDKIIPEWIAVGEKRKAETKKALQAYMRRMASIRESMATLEDERSHILHENATLKGDLEAREEQIKELESKLIQARKELEASEAAERALRVEKSQLLRQLQQRDNVSVQLQRDLDSVRESVADHLTREKAKLRQWCIDMLTQKERELERMKCLNQEKMHLVRQILLGDGEGDLQMPQFNIMSPLKSQQQQGSVNDAQTRPKMRIDEPRTTVEVQTTTTATFTAKGPPVVNPKFTPGLNEGEGKWLEHQPPGTLELGTVLQPIIKNCKSVTNLKPSDFQSGKYTKYAVTHHEATNSGNIETQVFKGDVIPSATGGAQVIFHDVETLKQTSPAVIIPTGSVARKRAAIESGLAQTDGAATSNGTPTSRTATTEQTKRARRQLYKK